MINIYDKKITAYNKNKDLNIFGGYESDISHECEFQAYVEDISDREKYGQFGIEEFSELKLVVSRVNFKLPYRVINHVVIDGEEYRILQKNRYNVGCRCHIEMICGLEVRQ